MLIEPYSIIIKA